MLRVRPHTSIFQQIILPHLSSSVIVPVRRAPTPVAGPSSYTRSETSRHQVRYLTGTASSTSPPDASGDVYQDRGRSWEPYTSNGSSSRQRTRDYLGIGGDGHVRSKRRDKIEEEDIGESYRKTTALALERITRSHDPPSAFAASRSTSNSMFQRDKGKGKSVESGTEGNINAVGLTRELEEVGEVPARISDSIDHQASRPDTTNNEHPFPPIIHQLLQARQFRLATLHILNTPSHALDTGLVGRVAGYMDRHDGTNAAKRLRKGRIPSTEERSLMTQSGQDDITSTPIYTLTPSSLDSPDDRMPSIVLNHQQRLTALYNTQLASQLSTSPQSSKGLQPPKSFPRPNTSLRQLRHLLSRIHVLQKCRGFVPDRVTANIVLSCWVRCALAPQADGVRVVLTRDKRWKVSPRHTGTVSRDQDVGMEELYKLFELVSRLFDRAAGISTTPSQVVGSRPRDFNISIRDETVEDSDLRDPGLNYTRHVKPFVKIFQHGFKHRKDQVGLDALREWDHRIKSALLQSNVSDDFTVDQGSQEP